jgi:hypothetical protein
MANARKTTEKEKRERMRKAHAELAAAMRDLLPDGSFAEREQAIIELTNEIQKEVTEQELQSVADGLGDEVKVKGTEAVRARGWRGLGVG